MAVIMFFNTLVHSLKCHTVLVCLCASPIFLYFYCSFVTEKFLILCRVFCCLYTDRKTNKLTFAEYAGLQRPLSVPYTEGDWLSMQAVAFSACEMAHGTICWGH